MYHITATMKDSSHIEREVKYSTMHASNVARKLLRAGWDYVNVDEVVTNSMGVFAGTRRYVTLSREEDL